MLTHDDTAIFSRSRGEGLTPPILPANDYRSGDDGVSRCVQQCVTERHLQLRPRPGGAGAHQSRWQHVQHGGDEDEHVLGSAAGYEGLLGRPSRELVLTDD